MKRILFLLPGAAVILLLLRGLSFKGAESGRSANPERNPPVNVQQSIPLPAVQRELVGNAASNAVSGNVRPDGTIENPPNWLAPLQSTITSNSVTDNTPATKQNNPLGSASPAGPLRELDLPTPPAGQTWPFYVAFYNPSINGERVPQKTLPELTSDEKKAVDNAAITFAEQLNKPLEEEEALIESGEQIDPTQQEREARKRWMKAMMRADAQLRLVLGYERYNELGRMRRLAEAEGSPTEESATIPSP